MAVPRRSSVRGSIVRGAPGQGPRPRGRTGAPAEERIADPERPRSVIDFGLQRRAAALALRRSLDEGACDADPMLLRTAKHHGEAADSPCPGCRGTELVQLIYVFGDELGPFSGRVRKAAELPAMAHSFGSFDVCIVEVCQRCRWNFLIRRYVLGDGVPRAPLRAPRDLMEA